MGQTIGRHDIEALKTLAMSVAYAHHDTTRDENFTPPRSTPRYNKRRAADALEERRVRSKTKSVYERVVRTFDEIDQRTERELQHIERLQRLSPEGRAAYFEMCPIGGVFAGSIMAAITDQQWRDAQSIFNCTHPIRAAFAADEFLTFDEWIKKNGIRRGSAERVDRLRLQYEVARLVAQFGGDGVDPMKSE